MSYIAVMNVSGPNSAMRLKQVKQTRSSKGRLPAKLPVTAKPEINNLSVCLFAKRRFKRRFLLPVRQGWQNLIFNKIDLGFQGDPLTLSHQTIGNRAWKHDNSESRDHNSRGQRHGSSLGPPSGTGRFCSCHSVIVRQGRSPRQRIGGIGVTGSNQSNDDLQKLVDQTLEKWGRIDVLVNSAGHGPRAPILEITDEDWHKGMDTYFLNAVRPARLVVPAMQKQKSGVIINISTAWAFEPSAMFPTSAVFRAGLASFTKIFADTYAAENIRMNNVLPGWIDSLPTTEERRESVPMQRYGKSEEIAATVSFLASDGAAYITGQNLRVDGGLTRSV